MSLRHVRFPGTPRNHEYHFAPFRCRRRVFRNQIFLVEKGALLRIVLADGAIRCSNISTNDLLSVSSHATFCRPHPLPCVIRLVVFRCAVRGRRLDSVFDANAIRSYGCDRASTCCSRSTWSIGRCCLSLLSATMSMRRSRISSFCEPHTPHGVVAFLTLRTFLMASVVPCTCALTTQVHRSRFDIAAL